MRTKRILHSITSELKCFLDLYDEEYMDYDLLDRYYFELRGKITLAFAIVRKKRVRTQLLGYLKQVERHYKVAKEIINE